MPSTVRQPIVRGLNPPCFSSSSPTAIDERKQLRRSHENPAVLEIYKSFLHAEPNSPEAHHLLHTHYTDRTAEVWPKGGSGK